MRGHYPLGDPVPRPLNPRVRAAGILLVWFAGVVLTAALLAPGVYHLGQWLAGEVPFLKGLGSQPFHRYLNRCLLLAALAGLMLPTLLLSGFIFPIAALPTPLRMLTNIVPARWFIIIVRGIMLKGAAFSDLWRETLILAGMTTALFVAGILEGFGRQLIKDDLVRYAIAASSLVAWLAYFYWPRRAAA